MMQNRMRVGDKPVRRTVDVTEIGGYNADKDRVIMKQRGRWDPTTDTFILADESILLKKIAEKKGITVDQIKTDINKRKIIFKWLESKGMRRYHEIGNVLREYYADPERVFRRAMVETV